jgi:iron-regulated transporter 1
MLCAIAGLRSVGDRSWDFILPLFLATVEPDSMVPTALLLFAQTISTIAFSPLLASAFERNNRQHAFLVLMVVENIAVVCGGALLFRAGLAVDNIGSSSDTSQLVHSVLFWAGLVFMGIESVCSSVLEVTISKDWTVALLDGEDHCGVEDKHGSSTVAHRQEALRVANAWIARTDLGVSIVSYILLGLVVQPGVEGTRKMLTWLCMWHVGVALMMAAVVHQLCQMAPWLRQAPRFITDDSRRWKDKISLFDTSSFSRGFEAYMHLQAVPQTMMTAYILVWLTVLSPSGTLTAWLTFSGVTPMTIATFRAASQAPHCTPSLKLNPFEPCTSV